MQWNQNMAAENGWRRVTLRESKLYENNKTALSSSAVFASACIFTKHPIVVAFALGTSSHCVLAARSFLSPAVSIRISFHNLTTKQQSNTMSFNNKTFVVTGANSGIGYDTAKYLADEGAKVYITGRNAEAVAKAAAALGKKVIGVVAEASSIADSIKLADTIAKNGDKLDG